MTVRKSLQIPPPPQWLFLAILVCGLVLWLMAVAKPQVPPLPPPIEVLSRDPLEIPNGRIIPPQEYDHPFDGKLTILRWNEPEVRRTCYQTIRPDHLAIGCAFTDPPNGCKVIIVNDEVLGHVGYNYNIVLRHEIAHCNGWRHDAEGKTIPINRLIEYGKQRAKELGLN